MPAKTIAGAGVRGGRTGGIESRAATLRPRQRTADGRAQAHAEQGPPAAASIAEPQPEDAAASHANKAASVRRAVKELAEWRTLAFPAPCDPARAGAYLRKHAPGVPLADGLCELDTSRYAEMLEHRSRGDRDGVNALASFFNTELDGPISQVTPPVLFPPRENIRAAMDMAAIEEAGIPRKTAERMRTAVRTLAANCAGKASPMRGKVEDAARTHAEEVARRGAPGDGAHGAWISAAKACAESKLAERNHSKFPLFMRDPALRDILTEGLAAFLMAHAAGDIKRLVATARGAPLPSPLSGGRVGSLRSAHPARPRF